MGNEESSHMNTQAVRTREMFIGLLQTAEQSIRLPEKSGESLLLI